MHETLGADGLHERDTDLPLARQHAYDLSAYVAEDGGHRVIGLAVPTVAEMLAASSVPQRKCVCG